MENMMLTFFKKYSIYLFLIGALAIGALLMRAFDEPEQSKNNNCDKDYPFINQDIDCATFDQTADQVDELHEQVDKIVQNEKSAHHIDRASVFFRDLNTRRWFGVDDTDAYYPGSLVKLPLAMAYYKLAELQPGILDEKLSIPKDVVIADNADQHYPPTDPLSAETAYPISELVRHMLIYSDNTPFSPLMETGRLFVSKAFHDLGVEEVREGDTVTGWTSSVRTYAGALRSLYNASYLDAEYSNKVLSMLSQSTFTKGIVSGVPQGVKVAHKFGEGTGVTSNDQAVNHTLNDCGIVYKPENPFVICIMTEGKDFSQMEKVIQDITRASYDAL
jgi:beta-lactamase class A